MRWKCQEVARGRVDCNDYHFRRMTLLASLDLECVFNKEFEFDFKLLDDKPISANFADSERVYAA